jgi:hypothetical protein
MAYNNLLSYFRDCYQADNVRVTIWNIFHGNIEHRIFLEDEEQLLNGLLSYAPVDNGKGTAAKTAASLYRKEKEFVYGSLFLIGRFPVRGEELQAVWSCGL